MPSDKLPENHEDLKIWEWAQIYVCLGIPTNQIIVMPADFHRHFEYLNGTLRFIGTEKDRDRYGVFSLGT